MSHSRNDLDVAAKIPVDRIPAGGYTFRPVQRVIEVSPSQAGMFRDGCERRWAYRKLLGQQEPDTPYTAEGTAMHLEEERWLRDGVPPNARTRPGRMALALAAFLPAPRIAEVERYIRFEYGGITYHGYIDAYWHAELIDPFPSPVVVYHDHKSTSDLKWAKPVDELLADPQRVIYGYALLLEFPTMAAALGRWGYAERKAKDKKHATRLRQVLGTPDELASRMEHLHQTAGLPIARAYDEPFEDRARNLEFCGAFGGEGCPFRAHCHEGLTVAKKLRARDHWRKRRKQPYPDTGETSEDMSKVIEELKRRRAAGGTGAAVQPETEKPKSEAAAEQKPGMDPDAVRAEYEQQAAAREAEKAAGTTTPPKRRTRRSRKASDAPAASEAPTEAATEATTPAANGAAEAEEKPATAPAPAPTTRLRTERAAAPTGNTAQLGRAVAAIGDALEGVPADWRSKVLAAASELYA